MPLETGFRVFDFDYIERLLEAKVVDLGLGVPWFMLRSHVVPVAERFYKAGTFVVEVLDEANLGVCQHYFLGNHDVRIPLKLEKNETKVRPVPSTTSELRIGSPAFVRGLFKIDAEANGMQWTEMSANLAARCVDRFYQDRLFFMVTDAESAAVLHELHKEAGEVDLPFRLSKPKE